MSGISIPAYVKFGKGPKEADDNVTYLLRKEKDVRDMLAAYGKDFADGWRIDLTKEGWVNTTTRRITIVNGRHRFRALSNLRAFLEHERRVHVQPMPQLIAQPEEQPMPQLIAQPPPTKLKLKLKPMSQVPTPHEMVQQLTMPPVHVQPDQALEQVSAEEELRILKARLMTCMEQMVASIDKLASAVDGDSCTMASM